MRDWQLKNLGDVIKLEYGKPLPKADRLQGGKYPAYGANGIKCWTNEHYFDQKSIIVGRKGSAGEVNFTTEKFWPLDVTYFVTYEDTKYDLSFLYHCLKFLQLPKLAKGVKPGVNRNDIYKIKFLFPSLPEQKRIVAILDEVFAGIDDAIANTEKNLANTRELFESYLESTFNQNSESWEKKKLADLCSIKHGFAFKSNFFTNEKTDYIVLTPGSFYETGGYRKQGEKTKYYVGEIPNGYVLEEGDFLFAMTEQAVGLLGSSLIVSESGKFLHNQRLGLVQLTSAVAWHNDFFFHQFNTKKFRNAVQNSASGVKVRHTSPTKLCAISVRFPSTIDEQKVVAETLNSLHSETQRLEAIYQQKLTALNELKQSILQKAFTGELTADTASQAEKAKGEIAA